MPNIVYGLCQPTLEMIKNDFSQFPEFREPKFRLVESMILNCTGGLFNLDPSMFETILHTVIYAMKHRKPEEMEIGLNSMIELTEKISGEPSVCSMFFESFYTLIIRETFGIMTDCFHLSGFKLQTKIIQRLLSLVEQNLISVNLKLEVGGSAHQSSSNKEFVTGFLQEHLMGNFPNLNAAQVEAYII